MKYYSDKPLPRVGVESKVSNKWTNSELLPEMRNRSNVFINN